MSTKPTVNGYQLQSEIILTKECSIVRAVRTADQQNVLLKFHPEQSKHLSELGHYRHEHIVLSNLDKNYVVNSIGLINDNHQAILILEDFNCLSLDNYFHNKKFSLKEFFEIAQKMTTIVAYIHSKGIIHKAIHPKSFLINPNTKEVKLTCFGSASLLGHESHTPRNMIDFESDINFISPELTGRMNRSLDYRSDLYSLGATLYSLLARRAPFQSDDPIEVVHAHIALEPEPIEHLNHEVPKAVSEVVNKLLRKAVEDRYQSAVGLKNDIDILTQNWLAKNEVPADFVAGKHDLPFPFEVSQKLHGREPEIEKLLNVFERSSLGTKEMLLIGGYSGIGKSSLVYEVHKSILKHHGIFLSGKFDQYDRSVPFSAVSSAFSTLIEQILTETPQVLNDWKKEIQKALGTNGKLLTDLIPSLELLIGRQPAVPELPTGEAQARFNNILQKFIAVFAKSQHPLVLFLDDMQWADVSSLQLLEAVFSDLSLKHLLVICAYRDNEVDASHPFLNSVERIKRSNNHIETIILGPLGIADVEGIVAESLKQDVSEIKALAKTLHGKSGGNSFFLVQLLRSLYQNNVLSLNIQLGRWEWDARKLQQVSYTENVIDLISKSISQMPDAAKNTLKLAACIGNKFDIETLSIVSQKSISAVAHQLWPSLEDSYIVPTSENFNIFDLGTDDKTDDKASHEIEAEIAKGIESEQIKVRYRFMHDRVQQAAYALIPEHEKEIVHLKIAELLETRLNNNQHEDDLFEITNHYNKGRALITTQKERLRVAELNIKAGLRAKNSNAYPTAVTYLNIAAELYGPEIWKKNYASALELFAALVDCNYATKFFEEAERLALESLKFAKSARDKSTFYIPLISIVLAKGHLEHAMKIGAEALELFGMQVPTHRDDIINAIIADRDLLDKTLQSTTVAQIYALPEMSDPDKRAIMNLLGVIWTTAYFTKDVTFAVLMIYRMVLTSIKFGNTDVSPFGYVQMGIISKRSGKFKEAREFGELAIRLNRDKFPHPLQTVRVKALYAHCLNPFLNSYSSNLGFYQESYELSTNAGENLYSSWSVLYHSFTRFFKGDPIQDVIDSLDSFTPFLEKSRNKTVLIGQHMLRQTLLAYQGKTDGLASLDGNGFNEEDSLKFYQGLDFHSGIMWYGNLKPALLFAFGRYHDAMKVCEMEELVLPADPGGFPMIEHHFYQSLIFTALYSELTNEQREKYLPLFERNRKFLNKLAEITPINFQQKAILIEAEWARVQGDFEKAFALYNSSIEKARESGFLHDEATASELAFKCLLKQNKTRLAWMYYSASLDCYQRWGATAKVQQLRSSYSAIFGNSIEANKPTSVSSTLSTESMDLAALMKASQALAGEIVFEHLLTKMLKILLESVGAEKVVLLLDEDRKGPSIQAWATTKEGVIIEKNSIDEKDLVCPSLLRLCERTKKAQYTSDALKDRVFSKDTYVVRNQIRSVLCTPLSSRGEVLGYIYLENNLASGVFNNSRMQFVELLASQAAISLQNSMLFSEMEERVRARTSELNASLLMLRERDAQLANSSKLSAIGQMAGGIAHEINTPIAIIQLQAETLRDGLAKKTLDDEKINKKLQTIVTTVGRIAKIISGLRTFARDGTLTEVKETNIKEIIDDTLMLCQERFKINGVNLICENAFPDLKVPCRSTQIGQVLLNLMNNAFDVIEHLPEPWLKISVHDASEHIEIRVTDCGKGIPHEVRDKLFQPFFTTKDIGKGTGLGLSISKGMIKTHGGDLYVDAESANTCFVIKLPKKPAKQIQVA